MRILQIVTLISPENAYGGPVTVALNQCRALAQAGHDVTLVAGCKGFEGDLPNIFQGVDVKLFPAHQVLPGAGFAGLAAPRMLAWLKSELPRTDAVHVHLARDFVSLPAASFAQNSGVRTCLQTHGMIDPSDNPLARPLDSILTRRVLRVAHKVFHLTPVEKAGVEAVAGPRVRLEELHNGLDEDSLITPVRHDKVTVLYLARLQARKRPLEFVAAAKALASRFPQSRFRMVGPDEGQGNQVAAAISQSGLGERLVWDGPADRDGCRAAMAQADVYVLPSVDEPYPMSVLEAMGAQLPVIITESCGLAPAVSAADAGTVTTDQPGAVVEAIARYLEDPQARLAAGERARKLVVEHFSMNPIVEQLIRSYAS